MKMKTSCSTSQVSHIPPKDGLTLELMIFRFVGNPKTNALSKLLWEAMDDKQAECLYYVGPNNYRVDFTSMTQQNLTTGFQRDLLMAVHAAA
ncbi:hypothetical protein N1851_026149 [Merluccius polli]|uniref:WWE domain-containing protein n=1 Tax=Merluccius polli TaxID=89951 RepID=A0AA47NUB5_MERPO|nr:hypothetical protein N1851_026149 [Merluccius polli]